MRAFIICTLVLPIHLMADPRCDYSVRADVELTDEWRMGKTERTIHLTDTKDRGYFALGTLRKGQMNFTIKTHDDRGYSTAIDAKDAFQFLLDRFGKDVQEIRCFWRWGVDHRKVNELTGAGMDIETAVKMTWDAEQVMKAGYTKFEIIEAYGRPGKYREVEVVFRKP